MAEYDGIYEALKRAWKREPEPCVFEVDSKLVAEQLNGNYACRSEGPAGYVLQMCVNLEGPHQPRAAVADPSHISRVQRDGGRFAGQGATPELLGQGRRRQPGSW